MIRVLIAWTLTWVLVLLSTGTSADKPCDEYPPAKQTRCQEIWRQLNAEDEPIIARFGLDQQRRRDAGEITQSQHIQQNFDFIQKSTQHRLKRLRARMATQ